MSTADEDDDKELKTEEEDDDAVDEEEDVARAPSIESVRSLSRSPLKYAPTMGLRTLGFEGRRPKRSLASWKVATMGNLAT